MSTIATFSTMVITISTKYDKINYLKFVDNMVTTLSLLLIACIKFSDFKQVKFSMYYFIVFKREQIYVLAYSIQIYVIAYSIFSDF